MALLIRHAVQRDIPSLASLLLQVHAIHAEGRPDLFRAGERKYTDGELAEILCDATRPVLVAEQEGVVAGYAFCIFEETKESASRPAQKTLYIDDLCVDACYRGQRIGSALYDAVVALARAQNCDAITLNVWELNAGAMTFYRKMGLLPLKTTMEHRLKT